ncbi:hypothetical protein O4J56_00965 [Nocardiopsis sp. RSe5-2]|uniref:DUF2946 domain-containing protein n=1 Tax=Nocardiopsis endophytica TaxID=3018445 RepID=A0ABT4TWX5_9ACTN|nr:hypothetical protein [Nocardiopsis endophytica]MDA2809193.1 hypothetical protein [Nocardiopsis endophytica]
MELRLRPVWICGGAALALWLWAACLVFVPLAPTDDSWVLCSRPPAVAPPDSSRDGVIDADSDPAVCNNDRDERLLGAVAPLTLSVPAATAFAVLFARPRPAGPRGTGAQGPEDGRNG